jgi:hypothetical protein
VGDPASITGAFFLDAQTLCGAVRPSTIRVRAEKFDQLRVVDLIREGINNRVQIHLMAVCRKLNAIRQAPGDILKKLGRKPRVSPSNLPIDYELCLSVDGRKRPHVTANPFIGHFHRDILLLRADERPNFINLNTLSGDVADHHVVELKASRADFGQQPENGPFGNASHADGRADRTAFNQGRYYRYFLVHAQPIHTLIIHDRFSIAKRKVELGQRKNTMWF